LRSFTASKRVRKVHISFNLTVRESFEPIHLNLTQTRVLDVDPSLYLARKFQPLLIYVRGADRLNQHQSKKHIYTFRVHLSPSLIPLLLVLRRSLIGGQRIHEALGAFMLRRERHQKVANLPRRVLPHIALSVEGTR
jgi:hypothetical protein